MKVVEERFRENRTQDAEADDQQSPVGRNAGKQALEESDEKGGAGRATGIVGDHLDERDEQRNADPLRERGEDAQDHTGRHRQPMALEEREQQADGSEFRHHDQIGKLGKLGKPDQVRSKNRRRVACRS